MLQILGREFLITAIIGPSNSSKNPFDGHGDMKALPVACRGAPVLATQRSGKPDDAVLIAAKIKGFRRPLP